MGYYEDLEVNKDATPEEIKKAYKIKAQKAHPDRGGDQEEFVKVNKAYEVLSNSDKRTKYDNGESPHEISIEDMAQNELNKLFEEVVQKYSESGLKDIPDIIDLIQKHLKNIHKNILKEKKKVLFRSLSFKRMQKKIKHKSKGDNPFVNILINKRINCFSQYKSLKQQLKLINFMISMIEDYSFEIDKVDENNEILQDPYDVLSFMRFSK